MGYSKTFSRSLLAVLWEVAWSDGVFSPEERELLFEQAEAYGGQMLKEEVATWLDGLQVVPAPKINVLAAESQAVIREAARMILADREIVEDERVLFRQLHRLLGQGIQEIEE